MRASTANLYPNLLNCYMLPLNGMIRKSAWTYIWVFRWDLPAVPPEWPMFLCRVMLLVVLCLVDMVGDQSNLLINRMPQQHHTKAIISQWVDSNSRVHVNLKCSSLLNVRRIRGILLFVRGSMRLSGNVNWQMVRNISIKSHLRLISMLALVQRHTNFQCNLRQRVWEVLMLVGHPITSNYNIDPCLMKSLLC